MEYPNRILICGVGSIGSYYIGLIKKNWPAINISVLRSGKGIYFKELNMVDKVYTSPNELLKNEFDACIISSPATIHLEQALKLSKRKIPILIEKPIGVPYQAKELWDNLIKTSSTVPIFVGYIFRNDPCALYMKDLISKEAIGKIIDADFYCGSWLPSWREGIDYRRTVTAKKGLGGGPLLELSHEIDIALWFLEDIQLRASVIEKSGILDIDIEDYVLLSGISKNKTAVTIRLNLCTKPIKRKICLRGELGEITWDITRGNVKVERLDEEPNIKDYGFDKDKIFITQLTSFFGCHSRTPINLCTIKEGLRTLNLIENAYEISNKNI